MPVRIQRKRTKGWEMPKNALYVGRPSIFGNPFPVNPYQSAEVAVQRYENWLRGEGDEGRLMAPVRREKILKGLPELASYDYLACWCPLVDKDGIPIPCHIDVLRTLIAELEQANV